MRWVGCERLDVNQKKKKKDCLIDDSDRFERFYVMHNLLFQLQTICLACQETLNTV